MRRMAALGRRGRVARGRAPIQIGMGRCTGRGVDAGVGDVVILAVKVDDFLRPQLAQHLDLLVAAAAAGGEIDAEGFVLH